MTESLTVRSLVDAMDARLGLKWVAGYGGCERRLARHTQVEGPISLVGHLNLIHPNQIQVLGRDEVTYLTNLRKNSQRDVIEQLTSGQSVLLIIADGEEPPVSLQAQAEKSDIPLLRTPLPSYELINILRYFFSNKLAETITLHGVFMEVMGIGALLTGNSSVGKSELALELISRGHRLIADDAPEFARITPDILRGTCPPVLQDFLEVRGLGVLNIRSMYGDSAIKESKYLRLIVRLFDLGHPEEQETDRLHGGRQTRVILGLEIPVISLPVAPGRNLAVMVEAAVRNHLLRLKGYYAGEDLAARQRRAMQEDDDL
ncbi:HPr(Ser) kinase/phosphatase [Thioalkalivibrio denitrificans]|uniref:HPr kinase/phosphorylase n=1 Tax=Thioalkalivibrio denitrificans TaxID=108003 RepID=A0A1V3NS00_9GAMM|nr:HPr(Ser) kinase/phosphatase [Thioalkalivibrio denitrificans]OOG27821.1 HPr(Ser) kinase/phosphatase [Thioalkalivibrio denitrificans]